MEEIINGKALYSTKGAAQEYGRVGCNFYTGCYHDCSYCVHPDTMVLMGDGSSKRIDDIVVGDEIYGITKQNTRYNAMVKSKVLAKADIYKEAYIISFSNGQSIISSSDHRFLTNRGWKYVTGAEQGRNRRPFLTTNNRMVGIARYSTSDFIETDDYRRGYLSGMIRGDANFKEYHYKNNRNIYAFRLALKEKEGIERTRQYLAYFGIDVRDFDFPMIERATKEKVYHVAIRKSGIYNYNKIQALIDWNCENREWLRGFMAGIYDAEGGKGESKRMANSDQKIIDTYIKCLETFGFEYVFDKPQKKKNKLLQVVRIKGGLAESIRFVSICHPAIISKFDFTGCRLKNNGSEIHVVSIERMPNSTRLVDIETSTGTFLANGIVAHNCYLKRGAPSKVLGSTEVKLKKCFKDEDHALEVFCKEVRKHLDYLREVGIFFSFTTDPLISETRGLTFSAINMCIYNHIPVKILTKNATFVDYHRLEINTSCEVFKKYVSIGFTLTGRDDMEPKASSNEERIKAMGILKGHGIKTFASIEPVVDWKSSRSVVKAALPYCDHFKIGLRSGVKKDYYDDSEIINSISWLKHIILDAGKSVYFKESIRKRAGEIMGDKWIQTFLTGTLNMDGALID